MDNSQQANGLISPPRMCPPTTRQSMMTSTTSWESRPGQLSAAPCRNATDQTHPMQPLMAGHQGELQRPIGLTQVECIRQSKLTKQGYKAQFTRHVNDLNRAMGQNQSLDQIVRLLSQVDYSRDLFQAETDYYLALLGQSDPVKSKLAADQARNISEMNNKAEISVEQFLQPAVAATPQVRSVEADPMNAASSQQLHHQFTPNLRYQQSSTEYQDSSSSIGSAPTEFYETFERLSQYDTVPPCEFPSLTNQVTTEADISVTTSAPIRSSQGAPLNLTSSQVLNPADPVPGVVQTLQAPQSAYKTGLVIQRTPQQTKSNDNGYMSLPDLNRPSAAEHKRMVTPQEPLHTDQQTLEHSSIYESFPPAGRGVWKSPGNFQQPGISHAAHRGSHIPLSSTVNAAAVSEKFPMMNHEDHKVSATPTQPGFQPSVQHDQSTPSTPQDNVQSVSVTNQSARKTLGQEIAEGIAQANRAILDGQQAPQLKLMKWDGNPVKFQQFWNSFLQIVDCKKLDSANKLQQLYGALTGKAEVIARSYIGDEDPDTAYEECKKALKGRCGNATEVAIASLNAVTKGGQIANNDIEALEEFASNLRSIKISFKKLKKESELESNHRLVQLWDRLPLYMQRQWTKYVTNNLFEEEDYTPTFDEFYLFVQKQLLQQTLVGYNKDHRFESGDKKSKHTTAQSHEASFSYVESMKSDESKAKKYPVCPACKKISNVERTDHPLKMCEKFETLPMLEKMKIIFDSHTCFNCLSHSHSTRKCFSPKKACAVPDCKLSHHTLIHQGHVELIEKMRRKQQQSTKPREETAPSQSVTTPKRR